MRSLLTTPLGWAFLAGALAGLAALLGAAAARLRARRGGAAGPARWRRRLLAGGFVAAWLVVMLAACPLVAGGLAGWLARLGERWPPPPAWVAEGGAPDAVVVLAGDLLGDDRGPGATLGPASLERLQAGLAAARRWPAATVVISGGAPDGAPIGAGRVMGEEARRAGLPPERLVVETDSPDTRGNAVYSAAVLRRLGRSRVALVTSSDHMARARAAFAREGVPTLPVPSAPPPATERRAGNLLPDATALARTTSVVHELIGILVYRARGWI